jgi:hypothetical protein
MDDDAEVDVARVEREEAERRLLSNRRERVEAAVVRVYVASEWLDALDVSDFTDDELNRVYDSVNESVTTLRKLQQRLETSFANCAVCGRPLPAQRASVRYCSSACRESAHRSGVGGTAS